MKTRIQTSVIALALALSSPVLAQGASGDQWVTEAGRTADGKIIVTEENFIIAETDKYIADHVANHPVNTIRHSRAYSDIDSQVVIRENSDALYSHSVVDISQGAVIKNPEWNKYSIIQIIDEDHYSFAHLYPGDSIMITPEMVTTGSYVWLNIRTEVRPNNGEGYYDAHNHQDAYVIEAAAAKPYKPKGFDEQSLSEVRNTLLMRASGIKSWEAFGVADAVDPEQRLIASASGWAGLPKEHAIYYPKFVPPAAALTGMCAKLTLPEPPLDYDKGGFFSATVYGPDAFIATRNYAVSNRNAETNDDGSVTFHFNCPGLANNNMTTVDDWSVTVRMYRPTSFDAIMSYIADIEAAGTQIEIVER